MRRRLVDQRLIDDYAEVTGDRNPIHVDPVFAAGSAYGTTIGHGLLVAAITADEILGPDADTAPAPPYELEIVFLRPVPSGSEIGIDTSPTADGEEAVARVGGKPAVVVRLHSRSSTASSRNGDHVV